MNIELFVQTIAGLATAIALIILIRQTVLAQRANSFNALKCIYDENLRIRKTYDKGAKQIMELLKELKDENIGEIKKIYGKSKYDELRAIGYHFEFIGTLVKRRIIPFKVVFDIISFPDTFWKASGDLVKFMRQNYFKDFWENFEDLRSRYIKKRKKY